jgi:cullin 1
VIYLSGKVLPALQKEHDAGLLAELVKRGKNHLLMNRWMKLFFAYLDRYHVKYYSLPTLEEAGLLKFRELVFDEIKGKVTLAVLAQIKEERDGATIDHSLIRDTINLFVDMGMERLDVYRNDFEEHFLTASSEYYAQQAARWLQSDSTPAYLVKAERAFGAERVRVKQYLNSETEPKILETVTREVLVKQEMELLSKEGSGCRALLINDMREDLSRMYRMFSGINDGLPPMADIFNKYIIEVGEEKIRERTNRLAAADQGDKKKESPDDPEYVKALLGIHERFFDLVQTCFDDSAVFHKALKEAFQDIVNRPSGKHSTADLVSSYCDSILKSSGSSTLNDKQMEDTLDKLVQLVSYLHDKDVFGEHYRVFYSKRLLTGRSAAEGMERHIIGKLKALQGAQYTAKMEGMNNDLVLGRPIAEDFKQYFTENASSKGLPKIKFEVTRLTHGFWPTQNNPVVNVPNIFELCKNLYKEFPGSESSSKKHEWYYTLGNCEVLGRFAKGNYTLDITPLQAFALLQFADGPAKHTFMELQTSLKVETEVLKRVLHSLSCGKFKILAKSELPETKTEKSKKKILDTDSFEFNATFTSNKRNFRVPMASLDDTGGVQKRVEEDRGVQIEACIVRIMKARKTLQHSQLVQEVMQQLQSFKPTQVNIKKKIETLIERDYLERESGNSYKYLA